MLLLAPNYLYFERVSCARFYGISRGWNRYIFTFRLETKETRGISNPRIDPNTLLNFNSKQYFSISFTFESVDVYDICTVNEALNNPQIVLFFHLAM